MLKFKNTKFILSSLLMIAFIVAGSLSVMPVTTVRAQTPPAGCQGGPLGPPSPGTVCPDGSIPLMDGTLPIRCPGSSQQGPIGTDYEVTCPARPGRSECTFSASTNKCITADGRDVTGGDAASGAISDNSSNYSQDCKATNVDKENCGIIAYLVDFINILSALVGIVAVISLVYGGIQYTSARDNPQQAAAARTRILNTVLALVAYLFFFAFLQWLVPGGVL